MDGKVTTNQEQSQKQLEICCITLVSHPCHQQNNASNHNANRRLKHEGTNLGNTVYMYKFIPGNAYKGTKMLIVSYFRSLGLNLLKLNESLIVIQMVQTLHVSANILHVCIHKMCSQCFNSDYTCQSIVNKLNFSVIWKTSMFTNATNKFWIIN